jgi:hypothetical protein
LGALANLSLFFAIVSGSLFMFQIRIVCKLKLLAIIHEMGKCQIWGYAAVAALCDSNSEVPVREYNVTLPFVLLVLCVLVPIKDARDQRSFIREIIVPLQLNLPGIVKLVGFCYPERPDPAQASI